MNNPFEIASLICSAFYNPPDTCGTLSDVISHQKKQNLLNPATPVENKINFYIMIFIVILVVLGISIFFKNSSSFIKKVLYGKEYEKVVDQAIIENERKLEDTKIGSY